MKIIAISGTPGTGKSTLARFLAKKLGYFRLDLHSHYKKVSSGYDQKGRAYIVDYAKFVNLVRKVIMDKKAYPGIIIDTHISHHLPRKMVDLCVVLTCSDLKVLGKRLKKRKYSLAKIRENLDCEIFQVCLEEAQGKKHKIVVFDTSKGLEKEKILMKVKIIENFVGSKTPHFSAKFSIPKTR